MIRRKERDRSITFRSGPLITAALKRGDYPPLIGLLSDGLSALYCAIFYAITRECNGTDTCFLSLFLPSSRPPAGPFSIHSDVMIETTLLLSFSSPPSPQSLPAAQNECPERSTRNLIKNKGRGGALMADPVALRETITAAEDDRARGGREMIKSVVSDR